jgi:hypothetical protein
VDDWQSVLLYLGVFALFLTLSVLSSAGVVTCLLKMPADAPRVVRAIGRVMNLRPKEYPDEQSALAGILLLCAFQLPAIGVLQPLSPYSLAHRVVALIYVIVVGLWFRYLWKLARRS